MDSVARIDPVGTGNSLRFWQGNNSGALHRCVSNCTESECSLEREGVGRVERGHTVLRYAI